MTTISVHTHAPVAVPRGAVWAATVAARLLGWFDAMGAAQAAATARRREATRILEAGQLRRYAQQWASRDPRFAADLLAAADRHEWTA